jgi:hypothetical protein
MPIKDPAARKLYDHQKYLRNRQHILRRVRARYRKKKPEVAAYYRRWKRRNRDRFNTYHRKWRSQRSPEARRRDKKNADKWRRRNTKKVLAKNHRYAKKRNLQRFAHMVVRAAILCGILVRPHECSQCHKKCRPHAHHPNYSKPLEVVFLCHACHVKAHNGSFHNPPTTP